MTDQDAPFSANLKMIVTREASVSDLCRKLSINRQQFARYLSGQTRPSPHNTRKIEVHFGLEPGALSWSKAEFQRNYVNLPLTSASDHQVNKLVNEAFSPDLRRLRPYLGYHHAYFYSFGWQGKIMKTLVHLYEQDGQVLSKTIERLRDPVTGHRFVFKYRGLVTMKAERLFIAETSTMSAGEMALTILYGTYRSQATKLSGLTMGSSSASRRDPTVARVIYNKIGNNIDLRKALGACGLYLPNSQDVPSGIAPLLDNHLDPAFDVLTARPVE
ncbi:hypothetical protein TRL7639_00935 [Falsiruegeria litorea R37]|uniref:HTH cro/C1-type domain-containing protein n=1 Tax=Falsiruegeria litorea R37 TaxID=1200284 RepID=A0A1Y5RV19_9RHOB|nr:helix-turn-helix transcriptional regulator [Falsiruegeria litorea]SLN26185.1 hypothetical protein TRL7639_00935 [Falsiruegeria litorea R37]